MVVSRWECQYFLFFSLVVGGGGLIFYYLRSGELRHGHLLFFGFLFYIVLPVVVSDFELYENGPAYDLWRPEFDRMYLDQNIFFLFIFLMFFAYLLSGRINVALFHKFDRPFDFLVSLLVLIISTLFLPILVYEARFMLVLGAYSLDTTQALGPLATLNLIVTIIVLNFYDYGAAKYLKVWGVILVISISILLLLMGGRMYVLIPLVAFFLQFLFKYKSIHIRVLFLGAAIFLIGFLVFVSVWRASDSEPNYFSYFLAEPVLTSISMASVASCKDVSFFSFPYNFLSSFLNFIPNFILPSKMEYMYSLRDVSDCFSSPLGATNIYAAMLLNFGIFGSFVVAFLFFSFLHSVSLVRKNGFWFYYYLCSLLPFMLFRDGFFIVNKSILMTGVIIPVGLFLLGRVGGFLRR